MKALMKVVAVLALVAMASVALAEGDAAVKKEKKEALRGIVVSTTGTSITIKNKQGKETTVTTNAETKIKVEGKEGTLNDIKPGMYAKILPADGTVATMIAAGNPASKEHKEKKEKQQSAGHEKGH